MTTAETTATGTGLYLHVPFCAHRCHYCDFNTYENLEWLMPRYVAALCADLERVAAAGPAGVGGAGDWPVFTSVFVGGGTPTLLAPRDLGGVLRRAREVLPVAPDAEVTVEANPETVSVQGLAELVDAGLTRLSLGAQSLTPNVLSFLGRRHDAQRPLQAVDQARAAGVSQISLDLIYGAPGETEQDWDRTLDGVVAACTDHVSAYALTLEPNTPYAAQVRTGAALPPDDDVAAQRMEVADARLRAAGLARYEISNWARPGRESRHNLTYWRGGNYLGVGAGAHGHWSGRRWWSLRPPARYADTALAGASTTAGQESVEPRSRRFERLLLGLRLREGVARGAVEPVNESQVALLTGAGLLDDTAGRLRLTSAGQALANDITIRLAA